MKKIFLSLPMKGRTDEWIMNTIEGMKRIIKAYYPDEELIFVDNFTNNKEELPEKMVKESKNPSLLYLSKAIFKMADCTDIAVIDSPILYLGFETYNGCMIEQDIARRYGIKYIRVLDQTGEILLPDLKEKFDIWKKGTESGECVGSGRYRCKE